MDIHHELKKLHTPFFQTRGLWLSVKLQLGKKCKVQIYVLYKSNYKYNSIFYIPIFHIQVHCISWERTNILKFEVNINLLTYL